MNRELNTLINEQKLDEALKLGLEIKAKFPKDPNIYHRLISIYNQKQQKDKARECLLDQIELLEELVKNSDNTGYQRNSYFNSLAYGYEQLEKYEKANKIWEEAQKNASSEQELLGIKNSIANNLIKIEKFDEAAAIFKELLEASPISYGNYALTILRKSSMSKKEIIELQKKYLAALKSEIKKFPANKYHKTNLISNLYDFANYYKDDEMIQDYIDSIKEYSDFGKFESNDGFNLRNIAEMFDRSAEALEILKIYEKNDKDNPSIIKTKAYLVEKLSPEKAEKIKEELASDFKKKVENLIKNDKYVELTKIALYEIEQMAPSLVENYILYLLDKSPDSVRNFSFTSENKDKYPVKKILEAYDYVLKNDKNAGYVAKNKANFLSIIGKYDKAAQEYEKAMKTEADYYLYSNIISNYLKAEDQKKALEYADKYIAILTDYIENNEDNQEYLSSLANLYLDLGKDDEYINIAKKIVDKNPTKYYYFSNLARAYERLEKPDKALSVFKKFLEINEDKENKSQELTEGLAWTYSFIANWHLRAGDKAAAREALEKALSFAKKDVFVQQLESLG